MDTETTLSNSFVKEIGAAVSIWAHKNRGLEVTAENVFQEGDGEIKELMDTTLCSALVLPDSGISGIENLIALMDKAKEGASCLLLMEHYSNLDLPSFSWLLRHGSQGRSSEGKEIDDALVAIAGVKLSEDSPPVAALTSGYTRLVIYPSRSVKNLHGADESVKHPELMKAISINRAAMKTLNQLKHTKKIVLIFPSGTRYRPWEPDTKKGIREIDSYIKSFDYMCMASINGNCLLVNRNNMQDDVCRKDTIKINVGPLLACADFRNKALENIAEDEDRKQRSVDAVMAYLDMLHNE
ncbi:MAG: 1-acyl-sn-glycerol-3-phosphate acyltransferase [Spirochaetaceae bacterium]|nr:1-acyl-sn-glycerol-3-phosphate acyltransferase [Spirochaetaceae bacterium]